MKINYLIIILIFIASSCDNKNYHNSNNNSNNAHVKNSDEKISKQKIAIKILSDKKDKFTVGDIIKFDISKNDTINIDSVKFYVNNNLLETKNKLPYTLEWNSTKSKVGKINFKVRTFSKEGNSSNTLAITMLSDIIPKEYSYKVVNTYFHDKAAYTQGLVYENGFFYEATGQKGESTLRKVQVKTGDIIQSFTIPSDVFGEGITIFKDKIIQLSWQKYIGYVYDKTNFKLLTKFNYSTEGWGLTHNNENLIMSDGTHKLYFLDTETYSKIDEIEVYDNKKRVINLNELELINGDIYANIYTTDKIAIIDIKTGKVKAYINLSKILPSKDYVQGETDVLNGIAYDKIGDRLFVTGKYWTKLFEIKLVTKEL